MQLLGLQGSANSRDEGLNKPEHFVVVILESGRQ